MCNVWVHQQTDALALGTRTGGRNFILVIFWQNADADGLSLC